VWSFLGIGGQGFRGQGKLFGIGVEQLVIRQGQGRVDADQALDPADAGHGLDLSGEPIQSGEHPGLVGRPPGLDGQHQGTEAGLGKLLVEYFLHLAAFGAGRQGTAVRRADLHVQHRQAHQHQQGHGAKQHRPGPAHDEMAEHIPAATFFLPRGAALVHRQRQAVDAMAQQGQQGGQQQHRGDHGGGHGKAAGQAHVLEEALGQHEQAQQAGGDGQAAVGHGAAGGAQGDAQAVGNIATGGQFLAEAGHDEQGIVDGQAQAQHGHHVGGIDADVDDLGEAFQEGHGQHDGDPAHHQGQHGRHHGAEHPDQQQGQGRETDQLRVPDVTRQLAPDIDVGGQLAAHEDFQLIATHLVAQPLEGGDALVVGAFQLHHGIAQLAVRGTQLGVAGGVVADHAFHFRIAGDAIDHRFHRGAVNRAVHIAHRRRAGPEQQDDRGLVPVQLVAQQAHGLGRSAARDVPSRRQGKPLHQVQAVQGANGHQKRAQPDDRPGMPSGEATEKRKHV
jgi:hypothetical protein